MCTFSTKFVFDTATYGRTKRYKTRDVVKTHQEPSGLSQVSHDNTTIPTLQNGLDWTSLELYQPAHLAGELRVGLDQLLDLLQHDLDLLLQQAQGHHGHLPDLVLSLVLLVLPRLHLHFRRTRGVRLRFLIHVFSQSHDGLLATGLKKEKTVVKKKVVQKRLQNLGQGH